MTRLTSRFLVDLLMRRTESAGGFATVLAKGDEHSGVILVQCTERGQPGPLLERRFSVSGHYIWRRSALMTPKMVNRAPTTRSGGKRPIPICGSLNWTSQMRHGSSRNGPR